MWDLSVVAAVTAALVAGIFAIIAFATRLGARLPGSFGDGFVGFRGAGWPRGVQEDDDARWTWPRPEPAADRPWLRPRKALAPTGPQRGAR